MIDAIVYTSETGHTAQYAERLSQRTGVPTYEKDAAPGQQRLLHGLADDWFDEESFCSI